MTSQVKVSLSGPMFSFLLYENTKADFQQEGFLIGDITHKERKTITDNDQIQLNKIETIKIKSVMPVPQGFCFYNGKGKIDEEKLKEFLGPLFKKVVAWYIYKKEPNMTLTLRAKVLHKQLGEIFGVPSELFTCCLLTKETSDNCSTHSFEQAFYRWNNYSYDKVPIQISNLGEPNTTYKTLEEAASPTISKLLKGLKINLKKEQGLVVINKIQNALQEHIDSMVGELAGAEKELFDLEQEVKELRQKEKITNSLYTDLKSEKLIEDETITSDDSIGRLKIKKK